MAITRTAITDDDGSGTTGTIWNNAWKTELYDQIDAAEASGTVQTTTLTGTQNDFALSANVSLLRCNNASLLTLNGFAAGHDGQRLRVRSVGAGQVNLAHQAAGSTAANRLLNLATSAASSLAAGVGTAEFVYDATTARWVLVAHEQGEWITPAYAAGDYTASSGTWTVDAGDVIRCSYYLRGRQLTFSLGLTTTSVSATPGSLTRVVPGGFSLSDRSDTTIFALDANVSVAAFLYALAGGTTINFNKASGSWSTATNTTDIRFAGLVLPVS